MPYTSVHSEQGNRIVSLRTAGHSCRAIADAVGCSVYRVWYVLRARGQAYQGSGTQNLPRGDKRRQDELMSRIFGGAS